MNKLVKRILKQIQHVILTIVTVAIAELWVGACCLTLINENVLP